MPYPNEHSARLESTDLNKIRVRRTNGSGNETVQGVKIPSSISVIWYIQKKDDEEIPVAQALRFPVDNWTEEEARGWITDNDITAQKFEPAAKNDGEVIPGVSRIDRVAGKIGSIKKTDEGYLQGAAPVAKTGVMSYFLADGSIRRELVTYDALSNSESMKTLRMKPITDSHPPERLLDSQTVSKRKIGATGESVKMDGDYLMSSIVIMDSKAIDNIGNGRRELSPGYKCDVVMQDGTYNGERYDAIQTNRRYNHLAIVDRARGGNDLQLHLDSAELDSAEIDGYEIREDEETKAVLNISSNINTNKRSRFMSTFKIDGIEYNADQQVINHVAKLEEKADALQKDLDKVAGEFDTAKGRIDELEKASSADAIQSAVKARLSLERIANDHLDKKEVKNIDEMEDAEIKKAVIQKRFSDVNFDGKSEEYITARFDSAVELLNKEKEDGEKKKNISSQREKVSQKKNDNRNDSGDVDVEKSRNDYAERIRNAYRSDAEKK